ALEKVLWMESDRLGFFINTVNEAAFENEKLIVKNEKRQRVDNVPYGHLGYVIDSNMYPEGHPYSWQVIGSLEDLQNATLDDVKNFYNNWYGPNNATIVIAGDFDPATVKSYVDKYFGEIKSHGDTTPVQVEPVVLSGTKKLYHEDNFAQIPLLQISWPAVKMFHPDYNALSILAQLLSVGKKSPFYKVIVEEKKLAPAATAAFMPLELDGKFMVTVGGFSGVDLDDINAAVNEAFEKFETEEFTEKDLARVKAGIETEFYSAISGILTKSFILAQYNSITDDPGYITKDIEDMLAVTKEDIMRVYNTYIKDKDFIAASFVPRGNVDLILEGSEKAAVVEEAVDQTAQQQAPPSGETEFERTPSLIDRSVPPDLGPAPEVNVPPVWTAELDNGIEVYGIEHHELPLVQFTLRIAGGLQLDNPEKIGVANLMTDIMMAGTKNKTPEELEEEIDVLGSTISMHTTIKGIYCTGSTLKRNFQKTMDLIEEILLEPRWDEKEFELIKQRTINTLQQQEGDPNTIAANVFRKLLYGEANIFSNNTLGTAESVESISIDDLKEFYADYFSPSVTTYHVTGDITDGPVKNALAGLNQRWTPKDITIPEFDQPEKTESSTIYFVDMPDAKQSVVNVGFLALAQTDPDFYPATVMNYKLGGGVTGQFFNVLRMQKGYTYGAYSSFQGTDTPGPFLMSTSVQSAVTFDTVRLIKEIFETYGGGFSESDLDETKNSLIKSNALAFETIDALNGMLQNISIYGLPHDYVKQREQIVHNMSVDDIKALASKYIDAGKMIYLVVGDAKTQLSQLRDIGFGNPVLLDRNGNRVR
ncbi:M16 family metallopeptidase, partial [candidate division KSB1 bacterium]